MIRSVFGLPRPPVMPDTDAADRADDLAAATVTASAFAQQPAQSHAAAPVTQEASDALMRFVSASESHLTLPKDLWREVGKALPRNDLLSLRSVSKHMADWLDRSITSLQVSGKDAASMLATIDNASTLKHIQKLTINQCRSVDVPDIIAALSKVSIDKINLTISSDDGKLLEHSSLFKDISPGALRLEACHPGSTEDMQFLKALTCPIGIAFDQDYELNESQLLDISTIPCLAAVMVSTDTFNDGVATAFAEHPALCGMGIYTLSNESLEDSAVAILAGSKTLTELVISDAGHIYSDQTLTALAANRTLKILALDDICDDTTMGISAAGMSILSKNTTLEQLQLSVGDGVRYLSRMASLQSLTLLESTNGKITIEDAEEFARHTTVKTLALQASETYLRANGGYAPGALSKMLSAPVEHLILNAIYLAPGDVGTLLANRTLRDLAHFYPENIEGDDEAMHEGFSARDFTYTFTLAMHPTLASFHVGYVGERTSAVSSLTEVQRQELVAAWGFTQRPISHFSIGI